MPEEECRPILLQMEEDAKLGAGVSFQDVMWYTVLWKNECPFIMLWCRKKVAYMVCCIFLDYSRLAEYWSFLCIKVLIGY